MKQTTVGCEDDYGKQTDGFGIPTQLDGIATKAPKQLNAAFPAGNGQATPSLIPQMLPPESTKDVET